MSASLCGRSSTDTTTACPTHSGIKDGIKIFSPQKQKSKSSKGVVWYSSFWSEGPKNHLKFWSQSWSTSREGVGQGTWLARFSSGIQHQSHNWGSPFIDHNPDFRDGKVPVCNIFCQLCEGLEGNKILSGISLGGSRKYPGGADEDCKDWGHTQKV